MTDDFVDAGADALRVAVVVERTRVTTHLDGEVVDEDVDLVGGDAGANNLSGTSQNLCGGCTGLAHLGDDLGRLDAILCNARNDSGVRVRRTEDVRGHGTHGAHDARLDATLGALVTTLVLTTAAAPARVVRCREDLGYLCHGIKARADLTRIHGV